MEVVIVGYVWGRPGEWTSLFDLIFLEYVKRVASRVLYAVIPELSNRIVCHLIG